MSRNRKANINHSEESERERLIKSISKMSLSELNSLSDFLPIVIDSKLQTAINSDNLEKAIEAGVYMEGVRKRKEGEEKSILFLPDSIAYTGKGYKETLSRTTFQTLQRMGNLYCVKNIISTRIEQITQFLNFSVDEQKAGFTIRKKKSLFEKETRKLTRAEQKKAEEIVRFLENGGDNEKWDNKDSFVVFMRKLIQDSLTIDQLAFEIVRTRGGDISKFQAIDASMIRLLDSNDPRYEKDFEKYRYKGYLPKYCQVFEQQIVFNPIIGEYVMYYPWELGFGVRNLGTDIWNNGYGKSELESLIEIVTYILNAIQYNGNFFKNGSNPKGFIKMKQGASQNQLSEFKQKWRQLLSGPNNSHKIPIFAGPDIEWVNLQQGNKEMEFDNWTKFLMVILCSVYRIDPSELGFQFQDASRIFGQDGQQARLDHSKKKGLYPLLIFFQDIINKYLISEIDEEYEFAFTGIDIEDEEKQVDLDSKKLQSGMVSMQDMFRKYSGREFDEENDIILNPTYLQFKQMSMFGGGGMNDMVDEETGEEGEIPNPFEEGGEEGMEGSQMSENIERSYKSNPIAKAAFDYIDKQFSDYGEES